MSLMGMATNLVKAFNSAARVNKAAEFMCLPRVMDNPMPKKNTPNFAVYRVTSPAIVPESGRFGQFIADWLILDHCPEW